MSAAPDQKDEGRNDHRAGGSLPTIATNTDTDPLAGARQMIAAGRYGYVLLDVTSGPPVLYGAGDVVADEAEAAVWAAEVNACPPMTPWGPLCVAVAALVEVTS